MDPALALADTRLARSASSSETQALIARARGGDDIDKVAREFEALTLAQMLAPMFQGLRTDGPFGGGHGEEMFRSLLTDEYAKGIANAGGVGIAEAVKRELIAIQEAAR